MRKSSSIWWHQWLAGVDADSGGTVTALKVQFQEKEKSIAEILTCLFAWNLIRLRIHPGLFKSLYAFTYTVHKLLQWLWGILQRSISAQMLSNVLKTH